MPRTPNWRPAKGKPTPKPSRNRHRDPRLEDVSDTELHLPPRCQIRRLAKLWEWRHLVYSAPRTSIVTRQLQDRQRGRVTSREARLSPPSIEQVEHVVDVGRQFKGVAREGWKRLRHTCVEHAEPRIVATVALKKPAALLAQARLGPDEAVEQGIDRVLLRRGPEAGCRTVTVELDVGAVAWHIDDVVEERLRGADTVGVGIAHDGVRERHSRRAGVQEGESDLVRQPYGSAQFEAVRDLEVGFPQASTFQGTIEWRGFQVWPVLGVGEGHAVLGPCVRV